MNWVKKIKEYEINEWGYMLIDYNFVDFGSCGGFVIDVELWWNGFKWLEDWNIWLLNLVIIVSEVMEVELKIV